MNTFQPRTRPWLLVALVATLVGCAHIRTASLERPAELAGAPESRIEGVGGGRSGSFAWDALQVRFDRGADRLGLFGVLEIDRAGLSLQTQQADGSRAEARCKTRRTEGTLGVLTAAVRPMSLQCDWTGLPLQLSLKESRAAAGTRSAHQGELRVGQDVLQLQSVHRLQGSPLPLDMPGGYVVTQGGRALALIDLTGDKPRIVRSAAATDGPMATAIRQASLALALWWDPARTNP